MPTKMELKIARQVWDKVFGHVYDVESFDPERKKRGMRYRIKHTGSDDWSCDCKSWIYSSGTETVKDIKTEKVYKRTCKHVRFCMKSEGMETKTIHYE